jgi:hypothetical protein
LSLGLCTSFAFTSEINCFSFYSFYHLLG